MTGEKCTIYINIPPEKPSMFSGHINYASGHTQAGNFYLPLSYKWGDRVDVTVTVNYDTTTKSFLEIWVRSSCDTGFANLYIFLRAGGYSLASLGFTSYSD